MALAEERGGVSYIPTPEEELAAQQAAQYAAGNAYSTGTADTNYYAYGGAADPMGQVAPPVDSGYMTQQQTVGYYADPANASYSTAAPTITPESNYNWDGPQPAPAFPPQPSMQSQQVDAFLQSFPGGGGMAANSALGYPRVSPVAQPMIGARPGDVVDQNNDGTIDMPPPLPNTTWGGMMESTPPGGYSMPLNLPRTSDTGYIQPSVTTSAPYPDTTWGSMQRDPIGGLTVPMAPPVSDPGRIDPRVLDMWPGIGMGGPIPQTPPPPPGSGPPVGNPRNVGASPGVNPSIISGQSWDTSSGYGSVERSRAVYDIPGGPPRPITGLADAGQRWAPDPGPLVAPWNPTAGDPGKVNPEWRASVNQQPPGGGAIVPPPLPGGPAPAPALAPAAAPAPAAQGTPLITPTGEVYGTLTTNAQGQTVVKKLPKNAPNRWNIPQLPVTPARAAVPQPQVLPPGVTQTVAPGFPLPPNFLPPAWAEQAAAPAMPQMPRAGNQQGGGGRKKKQGR